MRLAGKVAIVTGGGSGIGQATALRLAEEGARVVVNDILDARLADTVGAIQKSGGDSTGINADITSKDDVQRLVDVTLEHFRGLDILVNNAGVFSRASVLDTAEEDWDRVLATNLKGTFLCTQAVGRYWVREERRGKIVNIASINAEMAMPEQSHYCASKGGVRMFTRAVAMDLAPYKINVNAVGPGSTPTNISPASKDPSRTEAVSRVIPLGRRAEPRDIANAVVFLCSSDADYVTGQIVYVDGGHSVRMHDPGDG